jgi:hypothetical protein
MSSSAHTPNSKRQYWDESPSKSCHAGEDAEGSRFRRKAESLVLRRNFKISSRKYAITNIRTRRIKTLPTNHPKPIDGTRTFCSSGTANNAFGSNDVSARHRTEGEEPEMPLLTADRPIGRHPIVRYVSFWMVLFCLYESRLARRASTEES